MATKAELMRRSIESIRVAKKQVDLAIRLANEAFGDDTESPVIHGRLAEISTALTEVENQTERVKTRRDSQG